MIGSRARLPLARGGSLVPSARRLPRVLVLAVPFLVLATSAPAQGLRGSLDTLPGASPDMSPYALGAAPDTAFAGPADAEPPAPENGGPRTSSDSAAVAAAPPPLAPPPPGRRPARPSRRTPQDDPYAQLGIRAGAFLVKPAVEIRGGYESNPNSFSDPEGSATARGRAELLVESDWSRHQFRGRIEGDYEVYDAFPDLDGPSYAAEAALRLDARRDLRFDLAFRSSLERDLNEDPEFIGAPSSSQSTRLGGSGGMVWKPNRVSIGLTGEVDRRTFDDPSLEDRDYTNAELRLRTGYELHPGLEPFIELTANERTYDEAVNDLGVRHDSRGARAYAGLRLEPDPIWTVEAKIGYGHQEVEDSRFDDLDGAVGQARVIWNPSALTELRLGIERDLEASTVEDDPLAARWRVSVGFTHEFRRWLILTGDFSYEESRYENAGQTLGQYDAELELEYKINRTFSALGSLSWERFEDSLGGDSYDNTKIEIGLRAQR